MSSTVKGWDGTAYCSSESSEAQASAEVERSVDPEHFQNQAIHKSIRRYNSSRSISRCSKRIAVDAGIAAGVGCGLPSRRRISSAS